MKLAALSRDLRGEDLVVETVGAQAVGLAAGVTYLLVEQATPATLGAAVLAALRRGGSSAVVFADHGGPTLARLAGHLRFPVEVREVVGGSSAPADPEPMPVVPDGPPDAADLVEVLRAHGLEVVLEDGTWRGELLGLEVARIVRWPVGTGGDGRLHIEAGVGRFDRDAAAAMHHGEDPETTLRRAIDAVARHRRRSAGSHPLGRLARPRWLRAAAMADPRRVGAAELRAVQTTFPASSVRDPAPAAALGTDGAGGPLLVVFAAGAAVDLVPVAADTRALHEPGASLRLAVPARDHLRSLDDLAGALRRPAEVVEVPAEWS